MKFIRYQYGDEEPRYGWVLNDMVGPVEGSIFHAYRRMDANIPLEKVRILSPVMPSKIIGIHHNYADHALFFGDEVPDIPRCFYKPPSAVIGTGDIILLPPQSRQVEHEVNLAIIIGKKGRWITTDEAMSYVFGYTAANDITARDLIRRDRGPERGKGFDTFCPVGPWIETDLDPVDTMITCRVNNELRQMTSTREMIFNIPQLVSYISSFTTLYPGDLILTGSPAGVDVLRPGDKVEITIEGVGVLINWVEQEIR